MSKRILNFVLKTYIKLGFYKIPLIIKIKNRLIKYINFNNLENIKKNNESITRSTLLQHAPIGLDDEIFLRGFKNNYKDETCLIIGNGPSLNNVDFSKISIPTFAVNSFFLKSEETGFFPTFYTVEDKHVMSDNLIEIKNYDVSTKFIASLYKEKISHDKNVYFYDLDLSFYRGKDINFSKNASKKIYAGQTVTYVNMQLAYYMGFKTVYLVGMDFNYVKPQGTIVSGKTWISQGDDPNHFSKDYFGKGKKYHDPQLDKVKIAYEHAKKVYESSNRKIINLTHGGKLEVFDRKKFDDVFK
jgi:hypothetical protein|tara:strand:- start:457 stop:1356 length:900 start_codon:yes stop_codon:yes gene_type:complete